MKTRYVLNRLFWDPKLKHAKDQFEITYIHRGAPGDRKTVRVSRIEQVLPSFFTYRRRSTGEEVYIPYHRILTIANRETGKVYYRKRSHQRGQTRRVNTDSMSANTAGTPAPDSADVPSGASDDSPGVPSP